MAELNYENIPSIIGIYEGTVATFEAITNKSDFYGRLILITGTDTDKKQALWTSEDDGTNAHYLNMSDVETLKAQLAHIAGFAIEGDVKSGDGANGINFKGLNGVTVTLNPEVSTDKNGVEYWTIEVNGQKLKNDIIGDTVNNSVLADYPNTITGAKAYTDALMGNSGDGVSDITVYGVKNYARAAANTAKEEAVTAAQGYADAAVANIISNGNDSADDDTIKGAKKYANDVAASKSDAAKDEAIQASKDYVNPLLANKADLEDGKIKESQLPDFILGQMIFGGIITAGGANQIVVSVSPTFKDKYDITTDSATIPKADASKYEGTYFIISEAAGDVLNLGTAVGDWVVSNGSSTWHKIDNTDAVTTVIGQTGAVTAAQIDAAIADIAAASRKLATAAEVNAKYTKPTDGIPSTDMTDAVQTSLNLANTAIQGVSSGSPTYIAVKSKVTGGLTDTFSKEIVATTATITSEDSTGDGLATVADIRAYLAARLSVKVVS